MPEELIRRLVVATLALGLTRTGDAGDDDRPGRENPLQNPARYTLFADQEAFLGAGAPLTAIELKATDAGLSHWQEELARSNLCGNATRRYASGRIDGPETEQVVCVNNYRLYVLGPRPRSVPLPASNLVYGRSFSVAAGMLDRITGPDGVYHSQIVVAYALASHRVRLQVLDWELKTLAQVDTERASRGDVAVAVGDLDRDGRMEIVLATGDADPRAYEPAHYGQYPGTLRLGAYRFENDGLKPARLERKSELSLEADAAFFSVTLVNGDFDGDGLDEVALGYYPLKLSGNNAVVDLYRASYQLELSRTVRAVLPEPAVRSYLALAAGLFRYDPPNNYTISRRQLAVTFADKAGQVVVRTYQPNRELNHLDLGGEAKVPGPVRTEASGPGLAAGNFVGQKDVQSLRSQLAVNVPRPSGSTRSYPEFVVFGVDNKLALQRLFSRAWPAETSAGSLWTQEIVAYDRDGKSLYLGAPVHITLSELVVPKYIIGEPPKHVDCFPAGDGDDCQVVNVSGSPYFTVGLSDSTDRVVENTSTDTSSWNIGGSTSVTSSATVSGGFGDIFSARVSASLAVGLSYDYDENTSRVNSQYDQTVTINRDETNEDDVVRADLRLIDIWRYPVFGLKLEDSDKHGFYELILPGPVTPVVGGGLHQEWYQPPHENHNALSYPSLRLPLPPATPCSTAWVPDRNYFPSDVGCFAPAGQSAVRALMNSPDVRYWDGNGGSFELNWTSQSGKESSKTYSSTLRENVDAQVGIEASANLSVVNVDTSTRFDFNFHNSNSWGGSTVSREVISSSKGITLTKPTEGRPSQAYAFKTGVYVTNAGALKVAHAVDLTASPLGGHWWREHYGGRPDPGLNLPTRFEYVDGSWVVTEGEAYHRQRGVFLRKTEVNPATGTHDFLPRSLKAGTRAEVAAYVYNFSLDTPASPVEVRFEYAEVDPAAGTVGSDRHVIGTAQTSLDPLDQREVKVVWDTTGLGGLQPGSTRYYRLYVTVDPKDQIANEIHEGRRGARLEPGSNNEGFWPWHEGIAIYSAPPPKRGPREPATADGAALAVEVGGSLRTGPATVERNRAYRLRARFAAEGERPRTGVVVFHEIDAAGRRRLIELRQVGLSPGTNYAWARWRPRQSGKVRLEVRVIDRAFAGDRVDSLAVTVGDGRTAAAPNVSRSDRPSS